MIYQRKKREPLASSRNCSFCQAKKEPDYKAVENLEQFVSERGKIITRGRTGLCSKHQKRLAKAVKRARHLALLPFISRI